MSPQVDAYVVHALPGRVRLRIPEKKNNHEYFSSLFNLMSKCQGLEKLVINPTMGSILIKYDHANTGDLDKFLEKNNYFCIQEQLKTPSTPAQRLEKSMEKILGNQHNSGALPINVTQMLTLGLVGYSCYQLFRGSWKGPAWHAALWYAYNLHLHGEQAAKEARANRAQNE